MAYTLANLEDDIRSYTEVSSTVLSSSILDTIIKNAENKIYREVDSDQDRFYATSNAIGDAGENFGKVLLPVVMPVAEGLKTVSEAFGN